MKNLLKFDLLSGTLEEQVTEFYDMKGNSKTLTLKPYEIKWIKEK